MKTIEIGGQEYTFKYSMGAMLYKDCAQNLMEFFTGVGITGASDDLDDVMHRVSKQMTDIPTVAFHAWHAGLIENHHLTQTESMDLLSAYLDENTEEDCASILTMLMEIMEEDGFFKRSGLTRMLNNFQTTESDSKAPKTPSDHKRKAPKKTATSEK